MGPFAVSDMSGLDIAWKMRQRLAATRDPRSRYVEIADQLCEAGTLRAEDRRRLVPLLAGQRAKASPIPRCAD